MAIPIWNIPLNLLLYIAWFNPFTLLSPHSPCASSPTGPKLVARHTSKITLTKDQDTCYHSSFISNKILSFNVQPVLPISRQATHIHAACGLSMPHSCLSLCNSHHGLVRTKPQQLIQEYRANITCLIYCRSKQLWEIPLQLRGAQG